MLHFYQRTIWRERKFLKTLQPFLPGCLQRKHLEGDTTHDGKNLAEHPRNKGSDSFRGIKILLGHPLLTHLKLLLTAGVWTVQGRTKMPNGIRPMVHLVQYPVSESHRPDVSWENAGNPTAEA